MEALSFLRKVLVDTVLVVALGIVIYSILSDVLTGSYVIHPVVVPEEFAHQTQTGDGVATALRSEVGRLLREAQTGVAVKSSVPNASEPDIQVAGTSVPLRYVAGLGRSLIRIPYSNISGQLSMASGDDAPTREACEGSPSFTGAPARGAMVHLVLQLDDATTGPYFDCTGPYPDIVRQGAWATLSIIDPFAEALLLSKSGDLVQRERAILLVKGALAKAERDDPPAFLQRLFPFWPDRVSRAHLTLGNIYLDSRNEQAAADEFIRADEAHADRSLWKRHSPAARDGLSIIALNGLQRAIERPDPSLFAATRMAACRAVNIQPDFDSAVYHLAQSYDLNSRSLLNPNSSGHICRAALDADDACRIYGRLLHDHPRFAVAYDQQAVMMLQRLHELRAHGRDGCSSLTDALLAERAEKLATFIDRSFVTATLIDGDRNYEPWLQRGILFFEVQDRSRFVDDLRPDERIWALRQAVSLYLHARDIYPANGYTWRRLGEALAALSDLSDEPTKSRRREEAALAFCYAKPLTQGGDRLAIDAEVAKLGPSVPADCSLAKPGDFLKEWDPPDPADAHFGPRWATIDCADIRGGARPASMGAYAPPSAAVADPAYPEDRDNTLDAGQVCRSLFPRASLRRGARTPASARRS